MAIKITDLTALAAPALADQFAIVDVTDTAQSVAGSTRRVTLDNIAIALTSLPAVMVEPLDGDTLPIYNSVAPTAAAKISFIDLHHLLAPNAAASTNAAAGRARGFVGNYGGRFLWSSMGPSGRFVGYQPGLYSNYVACIMPGTTTTLTTLGCTVTSVGTVSHPTPTQATGYLANEVTAGGAGNTAGTGSNVATFFTGDGTGPAGGYSFRARVYMPDASYDEVGASTGSRIFAGLTSSTMAAAVASDNPTADMIGFARNSVNAGLIHANWQIVTKDGATITFTDTGVAFAAQNVYDLYISSVRASSQAAWRIDNLTTGATTIGGAFSITMPTTTVAMRFGVQVQSVNAVARNIRHQNIYCDSEG